MRQTSQKLPPNDRQKCRFSPKTTRARVNVRARRTNTYVSTFQRLYVTAEFVVIAVFQHPLYAMTSVGVTDTSLEGVADTSLEGVVTDTSLEVVTDTSLEKGVTLHNKRAALEHSSLEGEGDSLEDISTDQPGTLLESSRAPSCLPHLI